MLIDKYLENLPAEVIIDGHFCVTLKGDKQPYDPIKGYRIAATDTFYPLERLIEFGIEDEKYETLGLKAGRGISIIDIDDCVDKNTGEISEFALEIIQFMKSYTELSPSGRGIRILFKAKNKFDFEKFKTKNSKLGLEYYDAEDQEKRGGRMCRLTGNDILGYKYREVDTSELLKKYLERKNYGNNIDLIDGEIDEAWVDVVYVLIAHRLDLKALMNREVMSNFESDTDLIVCNAIAEYTQNLTEINAVFKKTRYYRTKGIKSDKAKHKIKWDSDYGWNTIRMARPAEIKLEYRPRSTNAVDIADMIRVAVKFGLTKKYYFRHLTDFNWDKTVDAQTTADCLYRLAELKLSKANLKLELGGK